MFTNMQRHVTSSYFYSIGCRIVNLATAIGCVHIAESVGSRRELVANSCTQTHRRRHSTRQNSFVASASAVCIWLYCTTQPSDKRVMGVDQQCLAAIATLWVVCEDRAAVIGVYCHVNHLTPGADHSTCQQTASSLPAVK